MKISPHRIAPLSLVPQRDAPAGSTGKAAAASTEQTAFSPELGLLQQAKATLNELPEVDMDKVTRLRQAIANGELPLDLDALSEAVLELHRR
ncbi:MULTISPECIES: flagellar biosynthesis anti-sigma factor FlgM [Oceanimonas]|uniref:flagellar biosynthesis anti-sigma factor FlgM n=1 Tax=Oceanimonas TaxID=129577 RepID=UPI0003816224|nr:flagellar biosynthesis anti-sigma factor FlgM [Oceanimonas smirnovii]